MKRYLIRTVVSLGTMCFSAGFAHCQTEAEAPLVAERFLTHLSNCSPVTGTFRIAGAIDSRQLEAFRKEAIVAAQKEGYEVSFGPDSPAFNCRWAWDGKREMLETLPGSNEWHTFFAAPEGYLEGPVKGTYNLQPTHPSPEMRPASFYLVFGAIPWKDKLKDCELRTEPAPRGSPPDSVTLVAKAKATTFHLVVNKSRGVLHGFRLSQRDGQTLAELKINRLHEGPEGKVFPLSAQLETFNPVTGKVGTAWSLSAREISFPRSQSQLDAAFNMVLPEGASISDYMLSQQIKLKRPMSALDVIAGKAAGTPVEFKTTKPLTGTQTQLTSEAWWTWAVALLMSLPLGVYLCYRGLRTWKSAARDLP
jgi:hypothetical protein